jgi:hypothetical protein
MHVERALVPAVVAADREHRRVLVGNRRSRIKHFIERVGCERGRAPHLSLVKCPGSAPTRRHRGVQVEAAHPGRVELDAPGRDRAVVGPQALRRPHQRIAGTTGQLRRVKWAENRHSLDDPRASGGDDRAWAGVGSASQEGYWGSRLAVVEQLGNSGWPFCVRSAGTWRYTNALIREFKSTEHLQAARLDVPGQRVRSQAQPCARAPGRNRGHFARYRDSKPQVAVRDRETNPNPRVWLYRAELREEITPRLPLVFGDVVHNLRASLDHLQAALVPPERKRNVVFPIQWFDPWRVDEDTGTYIDGLADERTSWQSAMQGVDPEVEAFIKRLQPYSEPYPPEQHPFAQLSALDNADKHFELVTVSTGIRDARVLVTDGTIRLRMEARGTDTIQSGGVVAQFNIRPADLKAITDDVETRELMLATMADGTEDGRGAHRHPCGGDPPGRGPERQADSRAGGP